MTNQPELHGKNVLELNHLFGLYHMNEPKMLLLNLPKIGGNRIKPALIIIEFFRLKTSIYHCIISFPHTNTNICNACVFSKKRTSKNKICQYSILAFVTFSAWDGRYRQNLFVFRIELNVDYLMLC